MTQKEKKRYSLTLWNHKDEFLTLLKSPNQQSEGETWDEEINSSITGEETLRFTIPMWFWNKKENTFVPNDKWEKILNEEKIRYTEFNNMGEISSIKEFVLKNFIERRNGQKKTASCECQSLAVYELSKIGWGIELNEDSVTEAELKENNKELLTINYWIAKILYSYTKLGRVETDDDKIMLYKGYRLRNNKGFPISEDGEIQNEIDIYANLPDTVKTEIESKYLNKTGWTWDKTKIFKELPAPVKYIEVAPNDEKPFCWVKEKGQPDDTKVLKPFPLTDTATFEYVTDTKKRILKGERSNIFSLIQNLYETFELWVSFEYQYDELGKIKSREIVFHEDVINEDFAFDLHYGKNIIAISRNIDSSDLTTKLFTEPVESKLVTDTYLSIQNYPANPTGELYLYNFDYFFDSKMLTKFSEKGTDSDEFIITEHQKYLRSVNKSIIHQQEILTPLKDRERVLRADLTTKEAEITAYKDNIKSLQDKIDAIPNDQQLVPSWTTVKDENNHVGEVRTIVPTHDTTYPYSISFGREDVLSHVSFNGYVSLYDAEGNVIGTVPLTYHGYRPRYFKNSTWNYTTTIPNDSLNGENGTEYLSYFPDTSVIFTKKPEDGIPDNTFISGIRLTEAQKQQIAGPRNYVRIRYKYAPLLFYYLQIDSLWKKIIVAQNEATIFRDHLAEIQGKIKNIELTLTTLLNNKSTQIHFFENHYQPFIREGSFEAKNFLLSKTHYTDERIREISHNLKELHLNNSIQPYTRYVILGQASEIDIGSVVMTTQESPTTTVPRYRGVDFELYRLADGRLIMAIAPDLIDKFELFNSLMGAAGVKKKFEGYVTFKTIPSGQTVTELRQWELIGSQTFSVIEREFLLSDDSLITESLKMYGTLLDGSERELATNTDFSYSYASIGYNENGEIVNLNEQSSYQNNIMYDYVTRVSIKLTNQTSQNFQKIRVEYDSEDSLSFLFNDVYNASQKWAFPQVSYDVNVLDISPLKKFSDNYRPVLGQCVPIYDTEMGFNGLRGFIKEITQYLGRPQDTSITISSYKEKFKDLFERISVAASTITYNQNEIIRAANSFSSWGALKGETFQKTLDANSYAISLGVNNEITIDKKEGILLKDADSLKAVKIIGNGIFLTSDYSAANPLWTTGITGDGINASAILAGSIDTKKITIWNASEGRIRFRWDEEGLVAYGDKNDTGQEVQTDFNTYVKLNQQGLRFITKQGTNEASSVSLGWTGLNISAQNGAITLNGQRGLLVTDSSMQERVALGRLGSVYGLRLKSSSGQTVMQTDSAGQLWLKQEFNIGGEINDATGNIESPSAGLFGEKNTSNPAHQMGLIRNKDTGILEWSDTPIRFWAGRVTKSVYLAERNVGSGEILPAQFNALPENADYPTLSRFKVDAEGNIIASGIDVGGWIGAGQYLRSFNSEAILRSSNFSDTRPAISVGKTTSGNVNDYKFRVYSDGRVVAQDLTAVGSSLTNGNISGGAIQGTAITAQNLFIGRNTTLPASITYNPHAFEHHNFSVDSTGHLRIGVVYPGNTESLINFQVTPNGSVYAKAGVIANWALTTSGLSKGFDGNAATSTALGLFSIPRNSFLPDTPANTSTQTRNCFIVAGFDTTINNTSRAIPKFAVTNEGDVYFKGNIYGWYNNQGGNTGMFKRGLTSGVFTLTSSSNVTLQVVQGLVIDITNG